MSQMADFDPVIVNIPCPTRKEAEKLCKELLDKELGGTAKIAPTYLMYPAEKGATGEEVVLMSIKSTNGKVADIHEFILKNHSWVTPCIEVTPLISDLC